jgi:hypothetical protein
VFPPAAAAARGALRGPRGGAQAAEALQEARTAFLRGGVVELREDVLGEVRRALEARRAEVEAAQRELAREREEKEAQAARDSAAAEEAAAEMKARLRQQEEAAQKQKMSLEREKDSLLDRCAPGAGERDGLLAGRASPPSRRACRPALARASQPPASRTPNSRAAGDCTVGPPC